MKRFLALLLALMLVVFNIFAMVSCLPGEEPEDPDNGDVTPGDSEEGGGGDGNQPTTPPSDTTKPTYNSAGIIVPPYKDYGRGTKNFDKLALDYARPDIEELSAKFDTVSALIRKNAESFEAQLAAIVALEPEYDSFCTMYAMAEIFSSKDVTNSYWAGEYEYISSTAPSLTRAIESMYVACAQSPNVSLFESEYFGFDIEEDYAGGSRYTEGAIEYMAEEARLQSQYKSLSPSTVEIVYNTAGVSLTGTYEEVLAELATIYANNSQYYNYASGICKTLYNSAYNAAEESIFVELVKVRYLLAEELGYSSYLELAYDDMGYEYTPAEMQSFVASIADCILPAYNLIYSPDLDVYPPSWKASLVMNTGYDVASSIDSEFGEIYAFMLQHGLYDIAPSSDTRLDGSFTTSLYTNSSPFVFITTTGYATDFSTVMHEFGHFVDDYANYGSFNSLEISELCSQGLEFLSLIDLEAFVDGDVHNQLTYSAILTALDVLCYQGLLAAFEHEVYALSYGDITASRIAQIAEEVGYEMLGYSSTIGLSDLLVLHLFAAPMYVQSYCTSIVPALEIYLDERDGNGGLAAYKSVIHRDSDSFLSVLGEAGLSSPFDEGTLERITEGLFDVVSDIMRDNEYAGNNAA